jgi:CIC family chloride channel protein
MGATVGAAYGQLVVQFFPELHAVIPAFAIAGMAAAIGGTTGAVLTGIVMLTEMTADQSVVLPLIVVVLTAAAVRRGVMRESIYTMKLLRRGKVVPEGLQAAITSASRVRDVMRTDVTIVDSNDPVTKSTWVLSPDNTVTIPDMTDQQVVTLSYIVAAADDNFVATLHRLQSDGAQIILVTSGSGEVRARDIIGVLGRREIARHTESLAAML